MRAKTTQGLIFIFLWICLSSYVYADEICHSVNSQVGEHERHEAQALESAALLDQIISDGHFYSEAAFNQNISTQKAEEIARLITALDDANVRPHIRDFVGEKIFDEISEYAAHTELSPSSHQSHQQLFLALKPKTAADADQQIRPEDFELTWAKIHFNEKEANWPVTDEWNPKSLDRILYERQKLGLGPENLDTRFGVHQWPDRVTHKYHVKKVRVVIGANHYRILYGIHKGELFVLYAGPREGYSKRGEIVKYARRYVAFKELIDQKMDQKNAPM